MSDVKSPDSNIALQEIELLPNSILTNQRYNVRPFSTEFSTDLEDRLVEQLAASIERVGQLDAILITTDRVLIAGHRRRRAVLIINQRRSVLGQSLLKLRCAIDRSGGDLRQKAITSNLHRRDTSPMDLAYLIVQIRKEHNWEGWAGAKHVAEYLNVDVATITSHERLLTADKAMQNKVHERVISAQSAFDLLKKLPGPQYTPEDRIKAIERASEIQTQKQTSKAVSEFIDGKRSSKQAQDLINQGPRTRIERPAIVKAIRERHTTVTRKVKITLTRTELIAAVSQLDCDYYSEPARAFIRYLTSDFANGLGNIDDLRSKFLLITQGPPERRKPVNRSEAMVS